MTFSVADGLDVVAVPASGRWTRRVRSSINRAALIVLALLVAGAILAPLLTSHNPESGRIGDAFMPPVWIDGGSSSHLLGTDQLGRDVFARVLYGARISLTVSFVAIVIGGVVGTSVGVVAGAIGGRVGGLLMRIVDVSLSIPVVLVALVMATLAGPSFRNVIIVLALSNWAQYARQVRAETMVVSSRDFVRQSSAFGVPLPTVMRRHIVPNVRDSVIVMASLQMATAILLESSLSYVGVGIPPPTPALGVMVADGASRLRDAWWMSFFPGLVIALTVISVNLAGDWLRERLDPALAE